MVINNNPMNPVPLWPSKNYWYCKKVTNHGNCACPVVLKGKFPAMMLTIPHSNNMPTTVSAVDALLITSGSAIGRLVGPRTVSIETGVTFTIHDYEIDVIPSNKDNMYNVIVIPPLDRPLVMTYNGSEYIERGVLAEGVTLTGGDYTLELTINMTVTTPFTWHLYKVDGTSASQDIALSEWVMLVPFNQRTNTRYATINIDEKTISGTFDDGVYYMTVTDKDNVVHYSEPFLWLADVSRYTSAVYRGSTPVVTTENYIPFKVEGDPRSLSMFIPGRLLMPPFTFNDEVDEIDGRKYTRKQVSYKDEKCEFMCTAYFAEAIRLLWHCDIRYANNMRVEYMVRPEIDWNTDNHLCNVKLEFQGDTVMQTNGTASAYGDSSDSDHQSYDASFDASFQ